MLLISLIYKLKQETDGRIRTCRFAIHFASQVSCKNIYI